jgi:glycine/D-amino acid oxidase-like deaminating enzyme
VQIFENTPVEAIRHDGRRVSGVDTASGSIEAQYVINCGGMWGPAVGCAGRRERATAGASPLHVITEGIPGLARGLPTIKSSDDWIYVKNEGDGAVDRLVEQLRVADAVAGNIDGSADVTMAVMRDGEPCVALDRRQSRSSCDRRLKTTIAASILRRLAQVASAVRAANVLSENLT